jgi:hypothetical protein
MESEADTTITPTAETPAAPAADPGELVRERFSAVAARAGLEPDYEDVLHDQAIAWCKGQGAEPTRENLSRFVEAQKANRPKLFASAAVTTPPPSGARSTPTPTVAGVETPYGRYRALKEAGRHDDAKAFYLANARAINRSM